MIAMVAQVTVDPSGGPTVVVNGDQVPAFFWVFAVFIIVIGLAGLAFWIWALVDAIRVPDDRYYQSGTKLVWVLVIVLLQVIGAIVYLVAGRPNKSRAREHEGGRPSPRWDAAAAPTAPGDRGSVTRVALITGGAGGMGRAIAERFLRDGDAVVLADVDAAELQVVATAMPDVATVEADLTVVAECARMVGEVLALHGALDVLVNAAGVWVEGNSWEMTEEQWDRTIGVNLKGTFFASRYAIPELIRSEGCIVNISSDSGLGGNPGCAIYNASKFGVNGIDQSPLHWSLLRTAYG